MHIYIYTHVCISNIHTYIHRYIYVYGKRQTGGVFSSSPIEVVSIQGG